MNKSFLFAILLLATFMPKARATTIVFSGAPTARNVVDSSNTLLTNAGSLIVAGTFATPEAFTLNSGLSLAANYAAVVADGGWEQFGVDTVTNTVNAGVTNSLGINLSPAGKVAGQVTDNNAGATKADFFNNKPIYLWVFNAPTVGAATEMGIFRATTATIPWTFAPNGGGVGDSVTYSTTNSGASVVQAIGGFGSTPTGQFKLTNSFNVGPPVPEPSTAVFGVFTVLAAISSRRRRK